jgi:hypothetical protein
MGDTPIFYYPPLVNPVAEHEEGALGAVPLPRFQRTSALSSWRVDGLLVMAQAWPLVAGEVGRPPGVRAAIGT